MPFQKDERNMRPTCEVPISRRTIVQDLSPPLVLRGQWALPGHKGQVQVCWQKATRAGHFMDQTVDLLDEIACAENETAVTHSNRIQ